MSINIFFFLFMGKWLVLKIKFVSTNGVVSLSLERFASIFNDKQMRVHDIILILRRSSESLKTHVLVIMIVFLPYSKKFKTFNSILKTLNISFNLNESSVFRFGSFREDFKPTTKYFQHQSKYCSSYSYNHRLFHQDTLQKV